MSQGKPEAKGLIYFMRRADGVGPVKIGCSKWPEKRLAMFQVWSPEPLEIVASAPGRFADERRIHRQFEAYRLHSEWFEAAPPVLSMLAKAGGQWVTTEALLNRVSDSERVNVVSTMIASIRKKLGGIAPIDSEKGQRSRGYRWRVAA